MTAATKSRLEWVDAAKGLAIVLVVLTHASMYAETIGAESQAWAFANEMFSVLRMPLFFTLAGIFAASWVRRPWPELLRGKIPADVGVRGLGRDPVRVLLVHPEPGGTQ